MKKFTNHSPGLRGINTTAGTVWIEAGQSKTIDPDTIVGALPDLGKAPAKSDAAEADDAALRARAETAESGLAEANVKIDELTRQLAERDAAEAKRRSTAGKNKAQLLALAAEDGVTIEEGATNADIASAIELAREEKAKASA